jgi:hypothetical protein
MASKKRLLYRLVLALLGAVLAIGGVVAQSVQPFLFLQSGFTQELFGSTDDFLVESDRFLGGVTTLPDGDVVSVECLPASLAQTRLHRFDASTAAPENGAMLHTETILPADGQPVDGGCGVTYHPDGTLYLNSRPTLATGAGVINVDPGTGAVLRRIAIGQRGNGVGIAVDPLPPHHVFYAGFSCAAGSPCTIYELDPITGVAVPFHVYTAAEISFANGLRFDPDGEFLFITNRQTNKLVVVNRVSGLIVRSTALPTATQPIGLGVSAVSTGSPKFVVTNNADGTMTRFDFGADFGTQVPAVSTFASGGLRGDLMEAGGDGCLYVTQGGTRFPNGVIEPGTESNSIVRICGGSVQFAPPPGVALLPPPPTTGILEGFVRNSANGAAIAGATVQLGAAFIATSDSTGHYSLTAEGGTYEATVSAAGFTTRTFPGIVVSNGQTTTRDFVLAPVVVVQPGTLTGKVTNAATGAIIAGATVTVSNGASATTNAQGVYTITGITPGTYIATATAAGFVRREETVIITSGATTRKDFALTPANPCKKANDFFGLGPAGGYTLFTVEVPGCENSWIELTGKPRIVGDAGIGPEGDATLNGTIEGRLVVDPTAKVVKINTVVTGGTTTANLAPAGTTLLAAAARLAKLTPTQKLTAITRSTTINGNGSINVISLPSVNVSNGTVTIQGTASDVFVINVAGKFVLDASKVVLSGGVLPCNILWNFTTANISTTYQVKLKNGSTGVGIVLAPQRLVELQESTLTGRILSGGDVVIYASTVRRP